MTSTSQTLSTAASEQNMAAPAEPRPRVDAIGQLREFAQKATVKQDFYRSTLKVLSQYFDAAYALVNVDGPSGTLEEAIAHHPSTAARWQGLCTALLLDARYRNLSIAKIYQAADADQPFAVLAVPIGEEGHSPVGSLLLVVRTADKASAQAQLTELRALTALAGTLAHQLTRVAGPAAGAADARMGVSKAAEYQSLHELAFAMVNGLKSRVGCDQVVLAMVRSRQLRILCISGLDDLFPRSPGTRVIHHAMEECLDAGTIVCYQLEGDVLGQTTSTGHLLHKQWHNSTGNSAVASLPLMHQEHCVAVISLRRPAGNPFRRDELQRIQQTVSPLVPGLLLMEKASRSWLRHSWESLTTYAARWLSPERRERRLGLALAAALLLWVTFGTMTYRVSMPCEIVPQTVRQFAAPFAGRIVAAHVEPGDYVAAGQVLVEFDTRELTARRSQLLAQRDVAQLEVLQALEGRNQAQATQAAAEQKMAEAELAIIERQLAQAKIVAPADGYVLDGAVRPRVDEVVPLGTPLLKFTPAGTWQLRLKVPEFAATYLAAGQTGQFTTFARPDQAHSCRLRRVEAAAEMVDGKKVFIAHGATNEVATWWRAGMTGVARVEAGERPVWWVGCHRLIDTIRLYWWQL